MSIGHLVTRARLVQRDQVVRQRRARPAQPALQLPDLRAAAYDALGAGAYLSVADVREAYRFPSVNAVHCFLTRHRVPKLRLGRRVLVRAVDLARLVRATPAPIERRP